MALFTTSLELPVAHSAACDFFIQPGNLIELSPPEMNFQMIEAPEAIASGVEFIFEVSPMGMKQRSVHRIVTFDYPHGFVEEQIDGPLKKWVHEHKFESVSDSEAVVHDEIEFEPPGGMAGFIMTEARILDGLEKLFNYRAEQVRRLLGAE